MKVEEVIAIKELKRQDVIKFCTNKKKRTREREIMTGKIRKSILENII